jgi:hypothetical protein
MARSSSASSIAGEQCNSTFDKNRFIDSSAVFIAVSGIDAPKETGVPTREK